MRWMLPGIELLLTGFVELRISMYVVFSTLYGVKYSSIPKVSMEMTSPSSTSIFVFHRFCSGHDLTVLTE
jgi:hypothetical protein